MRNRIDRKLTEIDATGILNHNKDKTRLVITNFTVKEQEKVALMTLCHVLYSNPSTLNGKSALESTK